MKLLALDREGTLLILTINRGDLNSPLPCKSIKLPCDKKIRNLIKMILQVHFSSILIEEEMITVPDRFLNPSGSNQMTDYSVETNMSYCKQFLRLHDLQDQYMPSLITSSG